MNEKLNPSKSVGIPPPLGVPTCCLDKFFPSPIFVAFRFCFPQKMPWSFQDLDGFFIRVWKKNPRYSSLKDQNGRATCHRKREKENRVRQQGTFQRFRPFTFFDMPGNIENWTLQKNSKIDLSFTKKSINPWNWIGWFWFTLCLILNQHQPWLQLLKFTLPETNTSGLKVGRPQEECLLFSNHWVLGVNSLFLFQRGWVKNIFIKLAMATHNFLVAEPMGYNSVISQFFQVMPMPNLSKLRIYGLYMPVPAAVPANLFGLVTGSDWISRIVHLVVVSVSTVIGFSNVHVSLPKVLVKMIRFWQRWMLKIGSAQLPTV